MSFNEWKIIKLIDLSEKIGSGATPRGGSNVYLETGIPFIRSQNVYNCEFHEGGLVYIDEESAGKLDNVKLCKNDIILNITGDSVARCTILPEKYIGGRVNQHVAIIRANSKILNPQFLKYFLVSSSMQAHMLSLARMGATRAALTKGMIESFEIPTPDIKEQEEIAHILSTLDDKIEVNNQINKTIENMAQAYFDDMFPNVAAGDTTIGEYITPKRGKNLLSKDAISGEVPVIAGGLSPATYHNVSNTQSPVITISASGANAGFVNLWTVPVWSSDSSFIDYGMTKDVYFWYVMLKKRQKEIYDSQTGSAQPHIYPKHITIMPTIKLNVDEINLYTKRVTPLFKKIANNLYEISKLQLIRDTLLPKLMSGEIRVPLDEEGDAS